MIEEWVVRLRFGVQSMLYDYCCKSLGGLGL